MPAIAQQPLLARNSSLKEFTNLWSIQYPHFLGTVDWEQPADILSHHSYFPKCGLAQHPIVSVAHDDGPRYWPSSDLPAGVTPDMLAQLPCAVIARAVSIRPPQRHRLLQVPVRKDEATPGAPGSFARRPVTG